MIIIKRSLPRIRCHVISLRRIMKSPKRRRVANNANILNFLERTIFPSGFRNHGP
jgi:hypothetical protein